MYEIWDINDIYKALMALVAGALLGAERELKDKAAGLKTISVICLGSCLFTILSFKIGDQYTDAARIASYIVSGIGFLGAGVIFKDRFSVSGLTTASVIWIAAAIGMAIGFGEIFAAGVFLAACLLIIYTGRFLNINFFSGKTSKLLKIVLSASDAPAIEGIFVALKQYTVRLEQLYLESDPDKIIVTYNLTIDTNKQKELERFLFSERHIESFEI